MNKFWWIVIAVVIVAWAGFQPDNSAEIAYRKAVAERAKKDAAWLELQKNSYCPEDGVAGAISAELEGRADVVCLGFEE